MRAARPSAAKSPLHVGEHLQRLVGLAAAVQQARERDGGVGAAGLELERAAQRRLVAGLATSASASLGTSASKKLLDLGGRLDADELVDDARRP